jgi:DNA-binding MarR family transcriptional regulator
MTKEQAVKNGHADVTTLERVLQWHGAFRRSLGPIRVTPLQGAMLLFVSRHAETRLTDAARALCVRRPTLTEVVKALVRNRWVTQRRSVVDARVVHLGLSQRGEALTRQIERLVHQVNITLAEDVRKSLGKNPQTRTDLRVLVP